MPWSGRWSSRSSARGLIDAIGTPATQDSDVPWVYPRRWCRLTGGLELACAVLIASPGGRAGGLVLAAAAVAAAILTVSRHRDVSHVAPLTLFVALLAMAAPAS
jgi:hypothetical protein